MEIARVPAARDAISVDRGRQPGETDPVTFATADDLRRLELRQAAAAKGWVLHLGETFTGGYRSHVRECTTAAGHTAVLKLTATVDEAKLESAALEHWRSTGATVRLLDFDPVNGALLLERLEPGTPLPGGNGPQALDIAVDLLGRLHGVGVKEGFPDLADLYPRLAQDSIDDIHHERRTRGEPDRAADALNLMETAARAVADLCSTSASTTLLHGDFLNKNLLLYGPRYVAVDPIPRLGDPASEIGFFACHHPPVAGIFRRASTIAVRLGADPERAVRWAAVWMVLLATSAWREDQHEMDTLVVSPEFQSVLTGA
jgi:streptomycin 6-kinase